MSMTVRNSPRWWALAGLLGAALISGGALLARDIVVPADWEKTEGEVAMPPPPACPKEKPAECLVNSRRIRLNYEVRDVGPSGVSGVELWCTRDGRTWQRYYDERPAPGPLHVHVAEEGRYGFSLVVRSGVGLSSQRPGPGDVPQMWVEVDETKPVVRLHEVRAEAGTLAIHWSASDANMKHRPYTLSYAASREGPWTPIVERLDQNVNRYEWRVPKDAPYRFYIRVEAADRAGNVGHDTTAQPITVDPSLPRGVILGVEAEPTPADKR
jgi:hypothetical protein